MGKNKKWKKNMGGYGGGDGGGQYGGGGGGMQYGNKKGLGYVGKGGGGGNRGFGGGPGPSNFKGNNKGKQGGNRRPKKNPLNKKNVFRAGWRFGELVKLYPQFAKFVKLKGADNYKMDFKDKFSLYALSKYCLKRDFQLDVEFPDNFFVPNVPFRLELIIMVEEVLEYLKEKSFYSSDTYKGLELVSGSSCVYGVLAAKRNPNWNILASEIGDLCFSFGTNNIKNNGLEDRVKLKEVKRHDPLLEGVLEPNTVYDFCTYAPTYFASIDGRVAMGKRMDYKGNLQCVGKKEYDESILEQLKPGGEVEYINRLIEESKKFKDVVRLFSVQVGRFKNMLAIQSELSKLVGDQHVTVTRFDYGPQTRYGVVWTFFPELKIKECFTIDGMEGWADRKEEDQDMDRGDDDDEDEWVEEKDDFEGKPDFEFPPSYIPLDSSGGSQNLHMIHSSSDFKACADRVSTLLDHLAVRYTEIKMKDDCTFNLTPTCVTWVNKRGYPSSCAVEDGAEEPLFSAALSLKKFPNSDKIMMSLEPVGDKGLSNVKSMWTFLLRWWDRHILPNFYMD